MQTRTSDSDLSRRIEAPLKGVQTAIMELADRYALAKSEYDTVYENGGAQGILEEFLKDSQDARQELSNAIGNILGV